MFIKFRNAILTISLVLFTNAAYTAEDDILIDDDLTRVTYFADRIDERIANSGALHTAPELTSYLEGIINHLFPEYQNFFRVHILKSIDMNAFILANGSIYVNLGLLANAENEAQIASALSHEGSHFLHSHNLLQQLRFKTLWTELNSGNAGAALRDLSNYSITSEMEADISGFLRLVTAGYKPGEAVSLLQIISRDDEQLQEADTGQFESHPKTVRRIQNLNKRIDNNTGETRSKTYRTIMADVRMLTYKLSLSKHQFQPVILALEGNIQKNDDPNKMWYYLGEAYRLRNKDGDLNKAAEAYQHVLSLNPEHHQSQRSLGLVYMKLGEYQQAMDKLNSYKSLGVTEITGGHYQMYRKELHDMLSRP